MSVSGLSITPYTFSSSAPSVPPSADLTPDLASSHASALNAPSRAQPSHDTATQPRAEPSTKDENVEHSVQDATVVTQQINEFMRSMNHQLSFHLDEDLNRQVVSVVDKESGDVIRQLPSKEMLDLAKKMAEQMAGILLNTKV